MGTSKLHLQVMHNSTVYIESSNGVTAPPPKKKIGKVNFSLGIKKQLF